MKIEHHVAVVISCKNMHIHWWDRIFLMFDSAAPLEIKMELRDRVNGDSTAMRDVSWILPRVEFTDVLTYGVPGVEHPAGAVTLRIRRSDPRIIVAKVPYWDDKDNRDRPQYLMFKMSKLRPFFADAERLVPQSCEEQALDIDRLIGRLLYS